MLTNHFRNSCDFLNNGPQAFRIVRRSHKINHKLRKTSFNIPASKIDTVTRLLLGVRYSIQMIITISKYSTTETKQQCRHTYPYNLGKKLKIERKYLFILQT